MFDLEERQTERSNVSVNLSCRCDTGSRRRVILHPQPRQEDSKKEDLPKGAAGVTRLSSAFPSTSLCLSPALMTSVCFTHLLHNISSVRRLLKKKKKKDEMSAGRGERQTNQFERPDKCNKAKVYFRAPSKWVLRYCITLFI